MGGEVPVWDIRDDLPNDGGMLVTSNTIWWCGSERSLALPSSPVMVC